MTMVIAYLSKKEGLMIADSRASYGTQEIPHDALQKIVSLGGNDVLGYSGNVVIANRVISELRKLKNKKRNRGYLNKVAEKLPGLTKYIFNKSTKTERSYGLSLILGGILNGQAKFWTVTHENFILKEITGGIEVIGSGEVVKDFLNKTLPTLEKIPDIKDKADTLRVGVSDELNNHGISTVGGMLQIILLTKNNIYPISHGFIDLDPDAPPQATFIGMKKGKWVQHDLTKNKKYEISEPNELLRKKLSEQRILDFKPPSGEKAIPKWYLNYFFPCFEVQMNPATIIFKNPFDSVASYNFPTEIRGVVAVGFWGTAGKHKLRIILKSSTDTIILHEEEFERMYMIEDFDKAIPINFKINKPGLYFFELYVDTRLIGRKPLYIGKSPFTLPAEDKKLRFIEERMMKLYDNCVDPTLIQTNKAQLDYLIVCESSHSEPGIKRFENQFMIVFWKNYPLILKMHIASAVRAKPGTHYIRIEADNAFTRETTVLDTATVHILSFCKSYHITGDMIFKVPEPGIYYINLYVDEQRCGTTLLIAETDQAMYSVSLLPEDQAKVSAGELFKLVKRAQPKE